MKLGGAYALVPELDVRERDPALELRHLQALGRWATRYTPFVSLEPPDTLLLEVRGSLRLFGGAAALLARAHRELAARGWQSLAALAPTPRAATWLSRAAPGTLVETEALLAGRLGALGFGCTGWSERTHETLVRLGVRTLGELRRLPRDGLARRFDAQVLRELDEAFGLVPAPRRRHASPERFQERVDLAAELEQVEHLEPAFDRLLERMGRFLRVRNAGVERVVVAFAHRDSKPTCLALGRATPCGEPAEWRLLLRERLGRETLRAPVLAVALRTSVVVPLESESDALPGLATERTQANAWTLLDRLRARLGDEAVNGVCLVPEHRPEAAWRRVKPRPARGAGAASELGAPAAPKVAAKNAAAKASSPPVRPRRTGALDRVAPHAYAHSLAPRPLWLLAAPQRLHVQQGQPCYGGMLRFESGPERIESGWWDGRDVARDYYVAVTREGVRLWIYREFGAQARGELGAQARGESRWFLHGLFG
jgi:protein ImuB